MELERLQWVFCGSHNFCSCSLFTSNKFGRSCKDQEPAQQAQWIFAREGKLLLEVRDTKCKTTISSDWVFSSAWLVHANLTTRKGKLAKTNFSQRSLPSYNLIKPQQSTFKAARPQILVRRTRPEIVFGDPSEKESFVSRPRWGNPTTILKQAPVVKQTRVRTIHFTYEIGKVYGFDSPCPPPVSFRWPKILLQDKFDNTQRKASQNQFFPA